MPKNCSVPVQLSELQLKEYDCFTNITSRHVHRGVLIYTKKYLAASESNINEKMDFVESVWCEFKLTGSDNILIGGIYRSPNSTKENDDKLNSSLLYASNHCSHLLIMGDFNHPEINWTDVTSPTDDNHKASIFLESVRDAYLYQHVSDATHFRSNQQANILDLVFTNEESMIQSIVHTAPLGKSHHALLHFNFNCYTLDGALIPSRFQYSKGDYDKFRDLLVSHDWHDLLQGKKLNEAWLCFNEIFDHSCSASIPKSKPKTQRHQKKKPLWINGVAFIKLKKKRHAFQRYLSTREGADYLEYARARNQAKWSCRFAVREFERNIAKEAKHNPKAFYSYARSKLKTKDNVADLIDEKGSTISSSGGTSNILNRFFSSVFTDEDLENIPSFPSRSNSSLKEIIFTPDLVVKKLQNLNSSKTPGLDGFHPRVLKEAASELAVPLSIIFQKSFDEASLPQIWKDASVTPIFKKGKKNQPGNYRPVSLTSIVCKVMESIVRDHLMAHMISEDLLSDEQHGFRPGRSCTTNLLAALDKWTKTLDEGTCVDTIYLDFAKAFDSVPHQRLLRKLHGYGIQGHVKKWIESFLTNRRQRVQVRGEHSDWAQVKSGIPQGSVLGPILFIIFINDLPDVVETESLIFADDTKVFNRINSSADATRLQNDINNLTTWSSTWQLRFNASKCKVMHLGNSNEHMDYTMAKDPTSSVTLDKTVLERDLGVNVDKDLKFSQHAEIQVNKANKILGLIRRSYDFLDGDSLKRLFVALVRPILEYGNVAWSPRFKKDRKLIERVQRRATKQVPELSNLSYEERLKRLELPTLSYRRARGDMIEVYKYLHGSYQASPDLLPLDNNGKTRGHSLKLGKRYCRTSMRQSFFSYRVVDTWNALPADVVEAPNINCFKNRLDKVWSNYTYLDVQLPLSPSNVNVFSDEDSI